MVKGNNKAMKPEDVKTKGFFFPEHGLTIEAESQEQAFELLQVILERNK